MPRATQDTATDTSLAHTGLSPSMVPLSKGFWFVAHPISRSYNPGVAVTTPVWADPISLAATLGITLVFSSSGYLDVSVRRVRLHCWMPYLQYGGLPHSDTRGSMVMCTSPRIFAAYRVLLRLWEPRHSPYALVSLVATAPPLTGNGADRRARSFFRTLYVRTGAQVPPALSGRGDGAPSQYVNEPFARKAILARSATWRISESNR